MLSGGLTTPHFGTLAKRRYADCNETRAAMRGRYAPYSCFGQLYSCGLRHVNREEGAGEL
jgi:hypothetical protein